MFVILIPKENSIIKRILHNANLDKTTRKKLVPIMVGILSALNKFETLQEKILG
jgi:hypothetical protein